MITYLDDILDPTLLSEMIDEGYVQVRYHPDYLFAIYCYTKKAMFDRKWNDVTKICRGLIVNEDTGEVLARPFRKFFNYGEPSAPVFDPLDLVEVTDKLDGSLGILYKTPEGLAIATKGSFTSEQAKWATEHLRAEYGPCEWKPLEGITYLFEIIYPENRIVLDYGDTKALRLLATIDIKTGQDVHPDIYQDPFAYQDYIMSGPFAEVVSNLNDRGFLTRKNREGVVVRRWKDDERLKFKQEDYIELHKVMTGLNERQIWEWYKDKGISEILLDLPEEMHGWAIDVYNKIDDDFTRLGNEFFDVYWPIKKLNRKSFALALVDQPNWIKGMAFARYDNNIERAAEILWKRVKP